MVSRSTNREKRTSNVRSPLPTIPLTCRTQVVRVFYPCELQSISLSGLFTSVNTLIKPKLVLRNGERRIDRDVTATTRNFHIINIEVVDDDFKDCVLSF